MAKPQIGANDAIYGQQWSSLSLSRRFYRPDFKRNQIDKSAQIVLKRKTFSSKKQMQN